MGRRAVAVVAQRRGAARARGHRHAGPRASRALVLRYGFFYGPGSSYASGRLPRARGAAAPLSGRRAAAPGSSRSSTSTTPPPPRSRPSSAERPGIYNVVDDEPAPMREWVPVYAEAIGAKPPRRVPGWLARLAGGQLHGEHGDAAARRLEREGEGASSAGSRATRAGGRGSARRSASYASAVSMAPTAAACPRRGPRGRRAQPVRRARAPRRPPG